MTDVDERPATPRQASSTQTFPTRRISFEDRLAELPRHFAGDGDLISSHLMAALSSVFPPGEELFVRSVRHYRDRITDPVLQRQVANFIGQEATHGREHRALNERLGELGYPVARYEASTARAIAFNERHSSPLVNLAITAALEHFTATLAELTLRDEDVRHQLGHPSISDVFVWHAFEELEHKSVAFDVYRAVGGDETQRVASMRRTRRVFITRLTLQTLGSMLRDRDTYRPRRLWASIQAARRSALFSRQTWRALTAYDRHGFHPRDIESDELLEAWRERLFGDHGTLRDRVA